MYGQLFHTFVAHQSNDLSANMEKPHQERKQTRILSFVTDGKGNPADNLSEVESHFKRYGAQLRPNNLDSS